MALAVGTGIYHQADFLLKTACPMVSRHMEWEQDYCGVTLVEDPFSGGLPTQQGVRAATAKVNMIIGMQLASTIIIGLIGAAAFKSRVTDKKINSPTPIPSDVSAIRSDCTLTDNKPLKYNLFSCFEDSGYCMHGFCCYPCFTADLFASNKIHESFWIVWLVVFLPCFVPTLVQILMPQLNLGRYGPQAMQLFIAIFLAKCTGELRQKIGGSTAFAEDAVKWWLCSCCSVIQWQRQMDEIKGDRIVCFMQLNDTQAREVGDAFGVEPLLA
jgi:Cys-rich protein (TIGR01571 family)